MGERVSKGSDRTGDLVAGFRQIGVTVDSAVRAWSGLYPIAGGHTNFGYVFTRQRLLAITGAKVELWGAYSGPVPTKPLWASSIDQLRFIRDGDVPYERLLVGSRRLWLRSKDRGIVERWIASGHG